MFVLNPNSGVPIYRQLVTQVTRLIAGGQLAPGTELPSVRELAATHAINPMTISKAYCQLEAEGLLERQRGRPMRVAARRSHQASLASRLRRLEQEAAALIFAAKQLEIDRQQLADLLDEQWEKLDGGTDGSD